MPLIYINDLKKNQVAVCRALFDAAAKTDKGKAEKSLGIQMTADMPGLWSPLSDSQIESGLWAAARHHDGNLSEIGYLWVNLKFKQDSLDVTDYEKIYGISAKISLEAAGFTCSDKPIIYDASSLASYGSSSYGSIYNSSASRSYSEVKMDSKPFSKSIDQDKRFKKSTKEGSVYEALSFSFITDDDLRAYGAKEWTRSKSSEGDNVVLISQMATKPEATQEKYESFKIK